MRPSFASTNTNDIQVAPGWIIETLPGPPAFVNRYVVHGALHLTDQGVASTSYGSFPTLDQARAYVRYGVAVDASPAGHDPAAWSMGCTHLPAASWIAKGMPETVTDQA